MCCNTITLTVTTLGLLPDASNKLRLAVGSLLSMSNIGHASLVPRLLCMGREKKSLVHTVCTCSVPPGFLGIYVKYAPLR